MVHLERSTMPGWYKAYQIDRSEQQVHLQHLLHLEWSGYSFGYCTWCPVCSTSWLGSSLGVGPLPVGELNQNWSVLFFIKVGEFLGGLSLHLNHLIGSRVTNYDWPFVTLLLGLFGSNLDTRDLETYPRTYSGHFWHMSLFDDSRAVWVFLRKWVVSENQSFLDEGAIVTHLIELVLGGQVPRLNHGSIYFPIQNT